MATKFKRGKSWYVKFKDGSGVWRNISCGRNATVTDAEIIRRNYDAKELNQRHHVAVRSVSADLFEQLRTFRDQEIPRSNTGRPKGRKSIQRYKAIVNNFLEFLESRDITKYRDVTPERVRDFFDSLVTLSRAASTIEKHRQILNNFYTWSIAKSYCAESPMGLIRNPKRAIKPPRFFSDAELKAIFAESKPPYTDIFKFLYLTGLRIGELGNAESTHFIEDTESLRIPVIEGNKTKRECMLPLNKDAISIIKRQAAYRAQFDTPDAKRFIFLNKAGAKLDDANIYSNLLTVLKHCKILMASPHTFRHTCASHLVIKGVSLYIVRDILRHASIRETEIYAHLSKEAVRGAIALLTVS